MIYFINILIKILKKINVYIMLPLKIVGTLDFGKVSYAVGFIYM